MSSSERSTTSLGSELYDGISSFGSFYARLGLGVGSVIGVVLLLMGIYFILFNSDSQYANVDGVVLQSQCKAELGMNNRPHLLTYNCNVLVGYEIGGVKYTNPIYVNGSTRYVENQPILLSVSKLNPNEVKLRGMPESTVGSILFGVALLLMGLCYFNFYMSNRFKPYAAAQGLGTLWKVV